MSKFQEFGILADQAIHTCFDAAVARREEIGGSAMSLSDLSSLVETHMQSILDQGWQKSAMELGFKRFLIAITCDDGVDQATRLERTFTCLDLVLVLAICQKEEQSNLPFLLLEELFDVHTTEECEHLFGYIEKRKVELTKGMVPGSGKGLTLLKICSELLRRLSKETNTVFCGRILMFLASVFPLDTLSGVNKTRAFNEEPVHYDATEDVDADPSLTDEQKAFYKTFWSTRTFFSHPPSLLKEGNITKLLEGADVVVAKFKQLAKREEETSGSSRSKFLDPKTRKRAAEEMEEDSTDMELVLRDINANYDFPRLLSSRSLLDLEMEDVQFRRSVMLQFLILFQYVLDYTKEGNEKRGAFVKQYGKKPPPPAVFTLDDSQETLVENTKAQFIDLMKGTKPHGRTYTEIALTVLAHERNWAYWKANGCSERKIAGLDPDVASKIEETRLKRRRELERLPPPCRDGNTIIAEMYNPSPPPLKDLIRENKRSRTATDIIDRALLELDSSEASLEDQYYIANGALIQASREILRDDPSNMPHIYKFKEERYKGLDLMSGLIEKPHLEAERLVLEDVKKLIGAKSNSMDTE